MRFHRFVLRADGMMLYYKDQEMTESCAMPVDLRQVTDVADPDEMEQVFESSVLNHGGILSLKSWGVSLKIMDFVIKNDEHLYSK